MEHNHDSEKEQKQKDAPKYWLSLEQWRQDPEFQKMANQEFLSSPLSTDEGQDGSARRDFLKLMGASLALTTFGCVRQPAQKIVPYAKAPKEVTPGIANYYTSSFTDGSEAFGIIVKTREGRPIKVEGNPEHPLNQGGMSARAHAHILALYDPDRLTGPKMNLLNEAKTNRDTINKPWAALDEAVVQSLKDGGVAILTGSLSSPATRNLVRKFGSAFQAEHFIWSPINANTVRQGQVLSYGGSAVLPRLRIDQANLIVSIDCDFLGTYLSPTEFSKQFSKRRKPDADMNKLVSFESILSLTGTNADERHRIKPSQQLAVAMGLLHEIVVKKSASSYASNASLKSALAPYAQASTDLGLSADALAKLAEQLLANKGKSLVLAGGPQTETEDAMSLQVAVNLLNSVLGNDGNTIDYSASTVLTDSGSDKDLAQLIENINAGKVKTLIIVGINPLYAESKGLELAGVIKKVKTAIFVGDRLSETAKVCDYLATCHHPMEDWGDLEAQEGVYSIQQPTIQPLHDTRGFQDSLMTWARLAGKGGFAEKWYDELRGFWQQNIHSKVGGGSFENFWEKVLETGVVDTKGGARSRTSSTRSVSGGAIAKLATAPAKKSGYELVLYQTVGIRDGSLANISWLQEFPDPVTKIVWDNYLSVSPATARKENLKDGQVVQLKVGENTLELPVLVQPGLHDDVLAVAVGFGQRDAGKVANGVGRNVYGLAHYKDGQKIMSGLSASLVSTKKREQLACTQGHHSMEGRQIVVEATLAQFQKDAGANIHRHKMLTLWDGHKYPGHKWAMAIDLNSCTGCGSCVIACQSENNVPAVGKKYVLKGREMHWIRIDRYFVGEENAPDTVHMPLMCQHCDNAPCETVCPVVATVHGPEGTNDMIYNRCVGTRYCSNNCPYKVRRFNWFNYSKIERPLNMAMNPEVTVRSRGVMEKCTFCLHRVKDQKRVANLEGRKALNDGEVTSACAQSCPTNAIVFGDMNNPNSKVSQMFAQERSYKLLEEVNAEPAVRYHTKIRNTAQLKGAQGHGHSHDEKHGEGHS